MVSNAQMVDIFKALADPNRLQLFELLLFSDQTNSELMSQTGLSQNLLSHHLSVLTDAGLIRAHQSIGDARRRYYSPNLDVPRTMSAWWRRHGLTSGRTFPALRERQHVLFMCRMNASRSLMAEAIARHVATSALIPYSAGIEAGPSPELGLQALVNSGIPIEGLHTKSYREMLDIPMDWVITVCDRVHEPPLPEELTHLKHIHWSLRVPEELSYDPNEQYRMLLELREEIERRLAVFVGRLAAEEEMAEDVERT